MRHWQFRSSLDRVPQARTEAELDEAWAAASLVVIDHRGHIAARKQEVHVKPAIGKRGIQDLYLGQVAGQPWFVRMVEHIDGESVTWREVSDELSEVIAVGLVLTDFHSQLAVCQRCGQRTQPYLGGIQQICCSCAAVSFPRTDPCVIVAITDPHDRLLLARQPQWVPGRVSILAGFLEAGESAEQCVYREVLEEVGLSLTQVRYVSSQPWPMPRSLMLGFEARTDQTSITLDEDELSEARFYTRDELTAALNQRDLTLPPPSAIARFLIERWRNR